MTGEEIIAAGKAAKAIGKALGEDDKTSDVLLRVAEDTPEMTAAARSMAARVAVKERVKLKLYQPFARMLGVSKAYFEDTFTQEMSAKIADIPDENLITPAVSVAVPALQGLSYTFEEPNLKELYLNLLATASDNRQASQAHPAFAEIIKQLTPTEAKLLHAMLEKGSSPVVRIRNQVKRFQAIYTTEISYLLPLADSKGEPMVEWQVPTWVDNWLRLGLVKVDFDVSTTGKNPYSWVRTRPEYISLRKSLNIVNLKIDEGVMDATDFGQQFYRAVTR